MTKLMFDFPNKRVDLNQLDLKSVFGYQVNIASFALELKKMNCNSAAFVGDAIVKLAVQCYNVMQNEPVNKLLPERISNQRLASYLRSRKILDDSGLGKHKIATVFEIIIGLIFLEAKNYNQGLINSVDACLRLMFHSRLDLDTSDFKGYSFSREKAYTQIGLSIVEVYFRKDYVPLIENLREKGKVQYTMHSGLHKRRERYRVEVPVTSHFLTDAFLSENIPNLYQYFGEIDLRKSTKKNKN